MPKTRFATGVFSPPRDIMNGRFKNSTPNDEPPTDNHVTTVHPEIAPKRTRNRTLRPLILSQCEYLLPENWIIEETFASRY